MAIFKKSKKVEEKIELVEELVEPEVLEMVEELVEEDLEIEEVVELKTSTPDPVSIAPVALDRHGNPKKIVKARGR